MNTEYEDLDLDGLLRLSRSDAEHAGDMAEQARVMREMSEVLRGKVDLVAEAMTTLFDEKDGTTPPLWSGTSSKMMRVELNRLFETFQDAPDALASNASIMDELGSRSHDTLVQVDQLHVETAGGTGPGSQAGTADARRIMREASAGYLTSAENMAEPNFYNGLRETASDEPSEAPAPPAEAPTAPGDASPPSPQESHAPSLQSSAPAPPPTASAPAAPPPAAPPPAAPPPAAIPPAPLPTASRPVQRPEPGLAPRPRPTVKPVIGQRGGTPSPAQQPSVRPTPSPGQPVRPVIAPRQAMPGAGPPGGEAGGPHQRATPGNVTRPGIAIRHPGAVEGGAKRPAPNPNGVVRPVVGSQPSGSTSTTSSKGVTRPPGSVDAFRPTTRTVPAVIGSRTTAANPPPTSTAGNLSRPASGSARAAPAGHGARGITANPYAYTETGQSRAPRTPQPPPKSSPSPMRRAGQRGKPVVQRPISAAIERAIVRGASPVASQGPGQDVFAKFDRAKAASSAREHPKATERDSDDPWFVDRESIAPVLGQRKES